MGADYSAYTILGLRVDYDQLRAAYMQRNTRRARGCDHDVPEGQKFCGECGAEREVVLTPEFGVGDLEMELRERVTGASAIANDSNNPKYIFFGFLGEAGETEYGGDKFPMPDPIQIEKLKAAFREMFIPYGCWDTRNFGIWSLCYCSY